LKRAVAEPAFDAETGFVSGVVAPREEHFAVGAGGGGKVGWRGRGVTVNPAGQLLGDPGVLVAG
jgi:hypothetical protein